MSDTTNVVALTRSEQLPAVKSEWRPDTPAPPWEEIELPCLNTLSKRVIETRYYEAVCSERLKAAEAEFQRVEAELHRAKVAHETAANVAQAAVALLDKGAARVKSIKVLT